MHAYIFFSILEEFFAKIANKLLADGSVTSVSGCIWGRYSLSLIERQRLPLHNVLMLSDVFRNLPARPDYEMLRVYENLPDGAPIPLMITADRIICKMDYDTAIRHVCAVIQAVEMAFEQSDPGVLLMDDVSCVPSFAHYLVARRRGVPVVMLGGCRLPGRMMAYSNPVGHFDSAITEYAKIKREGLPSAERTAARAYIQSLRTKAQDIPYMRHAGQRPLVGVRQLRELAAVWPRFHADRMDYTAFSIPRAVKQRLGRFVRYQLMRFRWKQAVQGEKYVLFPLHYQPEASTTVRAPFFMDQCALAENIARALPAGYRLYIKEHSARIGCRPLRDVARLRAIPSARLIDPYADSRALVMNAKCVTVITSTMGWEALLLGIPVVVFGEALYTHCDGVHVAGAPRDYPALLRRALAEPPAPAAVEDFLAALFRVTFPGRIGHPYYLPDVLSDDNIEQIAGFLRETYLHPARGMTAPRP
jgi:hypothetical protein